jgi:hypothetical protein
MCWLVFGDTEGGARQHRIALPCAIGREHCRTGRPDGVHDACKKIQDVDIDSGLFARMVVAQEFRKVRYGLRDRADIVTKGSVEGLASVGIG